MTFDPSNALHLSGARGSSKLGGHKAFLKQLDPSEPYMTFYPVGAGSGVLVTEFGQNR